MPIAQETVVAETVPAVDSTDLPKIKEKALPTSDSGNTTQAPKPAEEKIKPAEEKAKPAEEKAKPAEEKAKPAEEKVKPAEEKVKPAEEKLKPAEEKAKLAEEKAKLAEEKVKSAEEKAKPAEEKVKPAEEKVKPAEEKVKPAEEKVKPAEEKPNEKVVEEVVPAPTSKDNKDTPAVEDKTKTDSATADKVEEPEAKEAAAVPLTAVGEEKKEKVDEAKEDKKVEKAVEKTAANGVKEVDGDKIADKKEEEKEAENPAEKSKETEASNPTGKEAPGTPSKTEDAGVSMSTENPDLTPKKAEAFNLLAQGKRHYFVKDYESAVETLGEVCAKFSDIYGETGTEMGDVYYYYGISLLELAREEANLLNVDKEDKKEGEDDEEEEEDEEMEEEAKEEEEGKGSGKKMPEDEDEKKEDKEENAAASADAVDKPADDSIADSSVAVDETLKEGETTMEEDEVNNLQLAWEMLELARSIYYRVNNELKLADIYLKLSEVSMESENYPAAIEDIEKGLAIYSVKMDKDARAIAEAYYKLGMAHANNDNYPEAVKNFKLSQETLLARVENLKSTTKPDAEISKDPFYKKENEIKELEALLPEMNARIEECTSDNKEIQKVISKFIAGGRRPTSEDGAGPSSAPDSGAASSSATSSKPVSDISHLVKKKRKPEEDIEKTEVEGKKIKLDESAASATKDKEQAAAAAPVSQTGETKDVEMKETADTASADKKTEEAPATTD